MKKLIGLMSMVLVCGLAGSAVAQTYGDLTLNAEYLFDSADPTADTSGNGYNLLGVGTAATVGVADGYAGQAYQGTNDSANSWASFPAEAWGTTGSGGSMTIEAMLLLDDLNFGTGNIAAPFSSSGNGGTYFQFEGPSIDGDTLTTASNYWWGQGGWVGLYDTTSTEWKVGEWHHWQYSQDAGGENMRMWFDGVLLEEKHVPGVDYDGFVSTDVIYLGDEAGSAYPWIGKIDNVRLYQGWTETAVPEPATMALLGLGSAAMLRRRDRKSVV